MAGVAKADSNLYEQLAGLRIVGSRLSNEAEIVHEIEDHFRIFHAHIPITRQQIHLILEATPTTFPIDWQPPSTVDEMEEDQRAVHADIALAGVWPCSPEVIKCVIENALVLQDIYGGFKGPRQ